MLMLFTCIIGFLSTTLGQVVDRSDNITLCYTVDRHEYCFYTDDTKLNWEEARLFCTRRNSTLPVIKDKIVGNLFQLFLVNASYIIHVIHVFIRLSCILKLKTRSCIQTKTSKALQ